MKNIMHASHLDTIGGVERLFYNFLLYKKSSHLKHGVLVLNKKEHPSLKKPLSDAKASLFYAKFFSGFKIPNFLNLRKRNVQSILNRFETKQLVYWNSEILTTPKQYLEIFYDHGASWFIPEESRQFKLLQRVDKIIACSHASKRMLELRWPDKKDCIFKVKNPLRPDINFLDLPKAYPLAQKSKVILGASGRLVPLKGFICALHTLKTLVDQNYPVELVIAGTGKDKTPLENTAKSLGINKHVKFLDYVDDMVAFYDSIDIFLCPSFREPFGLVALEAQARGLPVVATAVDGLPEAIEDKKTGFCIPAKINPKDFETDSWKAHKLPLWVYNSTQDQLSPPLSADPKDMAAAIARLIDDEALYSRFSLFASQRAKNDFSFSKYVLELEKIFLSEVRVNLSSSL
jgi:glycosyltransferase involved in cell wall biosynthesis